MLTSDLMFKGKSSLSYTNLLSSIKYKKQDDMSTLETNMTEENISLKFISKKNTWNKKLFHGR